MELRFLGRETTGGQSPTLYVTDQGSYVVQCPFTGEPWSGGCGCGEPWVAGEGVVDGVDGADVVAAGADQVGTDTAVRREGAQGCASSRRRSGVVSGL